MNIGVFDSGIGGLTVLRELLRRFPGNTFTYFGDTANVPYGTKSVAQIRELCRAAAHRLKIENCDLVVVACNTASSLALSEMQAILSPIPVLGVVEAGVQSILKSTVREESSLPILILGTRATVRSHIYAESLHHERPDQIVIEQACPLLVPMIEEGWRDHPILLATIREYALKYLQMKPGIALLACTHYPYIREAFETVFKNWQIIDSATSVANLLQNQFKENIFVQEGSLKKVSPVRLSFSDPEAVDPSVIEEIRGLSLFIES